MMITDATITHDPSEVTTFSQLTPSPTADHDEQRDVRDLLQARLPPFPVVGVAPAEDQADDERRQDEHHHVERRCSTGRPSRR